MHKILGLDHSEIKRAVFRLAQFDPTYRDEYGHQVIDYLVLDSLATYGQLVVTASEIRENIKKTFLLDFEESEINASAKRLSQKEMITYYEEEKRFEKPKFQILPETEQHVAENLSRIKNTEDQVLTEWREELYDKYKQYDVVTDNIDQIVENFQLFLSKMFVRHGVHCVALLYPEEQKTQRWVEKVSGNIIGDLPSIDSFMDEIVKVEIPLFFKNLNSKRKFYISSLFNSSFFWHLIQVDEKCSKLIRKVTKGQRLYLDNNILYSLVGLDGANVLRSVHSMLRFAQVLGYKLLATTKSIDEFHNSLNWKMKEAKRRPSIATELARIAIEELGVDSFLTAYWDDFINRGISIEEFVTEKSHIEDILQGLDIETTRQFRTLIEGSETLLDEMSILRSVTGDGVNENIIEHDSFHRIFIQKIRKTPKHLYSQAVAWFLTHDHKLPVYDRVARKGDNYIPFCILSNQWVQINRPLLARTDNQQEYEESFHILVTQPFLRTMISSFPLEKAYNVVLGRLSRYENMTPQLALNLVTDKHFMLTVSTETDDEKIEEQIESKFVDIAKQFQSDNEDLRRDIKGQSKRFKTLEKKVNVLEKTVEEDKTTHEKQIEVLETDLEHEKTRRQEAEGQLESIKEKFTIFKGWAVFAGGFVLASSLLWFHEVWLDWEWLDDHKNKGLIKFALELLFVFALLNIPLRSHWKTWLTVVVAIILAILGLASF